MIIEPAEIDFRRVGSVREETSELALLAVPLQQDYISAAEAYNDSGSDYSARALYRAAFAYVDGVLFRLRFVVLAHARAGSAEFKPEEPLVLQDQAPSLDRAGKVETRLAFSQVKPFLKFILRTYAGVLGAERLADFGTAGFSAMEKTVDVRNRIVHPKHRTHLQISDAELGQLETGMSWFTSLIGSLVQEQLAHSSYAHEST